MLILVKNQDLKPSLRIERPVLIRARQRAGDPGFQIPGFFDPKKNLILNPKPGPDLKFSPETGPDAEKLENREIKKKY